MCFFLSVRASFVKPWLPPPPIQENEFIIIRDQEENSNDRDEVDLTTSTENIPSTCIIKKEWIWKSGKWWAVVWFFFFCGFGGVLKIKKNKNWEGENCPCWNYYWSLWCSLPLLTRCGYVLFAISIGNKKKKNADEKKEIRSAGINVLDS